MSVAKSVSVPQKTGFDLKRSVVETLVAGLLALIVFGPVVGVDRDVAERPEVFVLGAFAGGLAAAFILKRLARS